MAKGKKPIGKIIVIVLVVFVVIGVVGSMGGNGSSSSTEPSDGAATEQTAETEAAPEPEPEPYAVTDEVLNTENPYMATITGTLTNNTDSEKSYLQIEYVLYDADGAQIGTALANTNNLKAGGVWKFEAASTVAPDEVASWERADVTGF